MDGKCIEQDQKIQILLRLKLFLNQIFNIVFSVQNQTHLNQPAKFLTTLQIERFYFFHSDQTEFFKKLPRSLI
jgi:hypothetical protein